jgi:hypothetical protein
MNDFPSPGCKALLIEEEVNSFMDAPLPESRYPTQVVDVLSLIPSAGLLERGILCDKCRSVEHLWRVRYSSPTPSSNFCIVCRCYLIPIEDPDAEETTREAVLTA